MLGCILEFLLKTDNKDQEVWEELFEAMGGIKVYWSEKENLQDIFDHMVKVNQLVEKIN